eukprot:CAMPEP_0178390050 /NCGR_PEP_ID=MMETSP0689_2-20121128/10444_1 /TAXON_ID=160604 /ORGANISM="Amphidinium massartii, Strain CS-259" /LENGTH=632 /DNA_ID=CAMNT_0020010543 /DNA_START=31 /DNA_END=1926 /DNA_ORIENTATION=+
MPQADLLISSARSSVTSARLYRLDVPEGCTVRELKRLVANGHFGTKVPYAEKLRCRHPLEEGYALYEDSAMVPTSPARMCVEGPPSNASVVSALELLLKDRQISAAPSAALTPEVGGVWPPKDDNLGMVHEAAKRPFRPIDFDRDTVAVARRKIADHRGVTTASVTLLTGSLVLEDATRLSDVGPRQIQVSVEIAAKAHAGVIGGSALNLPLDEADVISICSQYPAFKGKKIPARATFWSRGELELFLSSNGRLVPHGSMRRGKTSCELLSRLRAALAEQKVGEATPEYMSLSRRLEAFGDDRQRLLQLPHVETALQVPRGPSPLAVLETPFVVAKGVFAAVEDWNLDFWQVVNGRWEWPCQSTSPRCTGDVLSGTETFEITSTVAEYIDYSMVLMEKDPSCTPSECMAYYRVVMDRLPLFSHTMREVFETRWREFVPGGLEDCTARWVQMLADRVQASWLDLYADYFQVSISGPGCIDRLHREANEAHLWLAVTEGSRMFHMFPPDASDKLYVRTDTVAGTAADSSIRALSAVDIFNPNQRKHSKYTGGGLTAYSALVEAGETLIIPAGWWWYAATLAPSVTVMHYFYNCSNRVHIVADLEERLTRNNCGPEAERILQEFRVQLAEFREDI